MVTPNQPAEISIAPEIHLLENMASAGHEGYLSVKIPMVGIVDFLKETPSVVTNEFGLGKPEHIVAKDIMGTEYELLLNQNGSIAIPEEGLGKFSVLSEMTFMFSVDQVLQPANNTIHLMPPPDFIGKFTPEIHVSQTDPDTLFESVISARKVPIVCGELDAFNVVDHEATNAYLHQVVHTLYSEFDFTKAMLNGDSFGLSHQNGFNNMGISHEAIGVYYSLWVDGLAEHRISGDELFSRISPEDLHDIKTNYLGEIPDLHNLFLSTDHMDNAALSQIMPNKVILTELTLHDFDFSKDKLDLSGLLEKNHMLSSENFEAKVQGNDVKIMVTEPDTGESYSVATFVNVVSPHNPLPDNLHNFIQFDS